MNKKVGFIGFGNMAQAIAGGIIKSKKNLILNAFDLMPDKELKMKENGINICADEIDLVNNSDIVILAIKPQNYKDALEKIRLSDFKNKVFVSIAAGISIKNIQDLLGFECKIVRVMPNTPLLISEGACALCIGDNVEKEDSKLVTEIFECSGIVKLLDEEYMNAVIAVNGSSPAYIYLFFKAMTDYALSEGIDYKTASDLICQTLRGSASMLEKSGDSADELIKKVSSPGGTTIEALKELKKGNFSQTVKNAMAACTKRAIELSQN